MYYFNIDGSIPGDGVAEALLLPVQRAVTVLGGAPGTIRLQIIFVCLLHPLLWGKKTLWRFIYIERLIYFYRMNPFIILLYLTYYRYLTLNLHFYSKTFDHFPFYWSYGADEMTEFV